MKLRLAIIAALFAMLGFTGSVWAKDAPNANANDMAKARSHGHQGLVMSGKLVEEDEPAPASTNSEEVVVEEVVVDNGGMLF